MSRSCTPLLLGTCMAAAGQLYTSINVGTTRFAPSLVYYILGRISLLKSN
jgi:hypothetical protein